MSTKQLISAYRGEIEYVNFQRRLDTYLKKSKILFSKENYTLFEKYDSILVMSSLSISARSNAINHLNMITPLLDVNWSDVTKNDIEGLIVKIMKKYGNKKGQETFVSSALKGQVKTFVRWIKLGSRSFREVGDPEETKFIQRKKIRPKLTKEMLIDDNCWRKKINYSCMLNLQWVHSGLLSSYSRPQFLHFMESFMIHWIKTKVCGY